ncbi:winged helix-turn-helix transcriptional regulator [Mucilaginibacter ginsenosidivorax]|uniref:Helix-turn-helix transcriptional regulator n=1 Tax=Mucilaginibacter ginsenosidivorax TaxID=862126 RepID=A0A5B8VW36_9SPHI|nr:helix-turn-helix domain-containing protein [Mucilaginibacter ginsenosidivorax]QEC75894.1 helix-turn-helix transcriptional regulator [Mucilaginibacter ginsenosidivorax]
MKKENLKKCEGDRDDCPIKDVLARIGDKWSMLTVIMLSDHDTLRFNELHQLIDNISQKMLTVTLKTLEADGLVSRKMYPQIPPKVEYTLTALGESLVPPLMTLYDWANKSMPAIKASREHYGQPVPR